MALRYIIPTDGLELLQEFLRLTLEPPTSKGLDDVTFIAIDFEHLGNIKQQSAQDLDSQVGVVVLDTKDLISSPP